MTLREAIEALERSGCQDPAVWKDFVPAIEALFLEVDGLVHREHAGALEFLDQHDPNDEYALKAKICARYEETA